METRTVVVKKFCSFSRELLCLDKSGLICVTMANQSDVDLLKMVGKTYEFSGAVSKDGNQLFVKLYREVGYE